MYSAGIRSEQVGEKMAVNMEISTAGRKKDVLMAELHVARSYRPS